MDKLTVKQKKVLDFIRGSIDAGVVPTIRELAEVFGISIGPVQRYIKALEKKGYIRRKSGLARGIELVSRGAFISIPVLGNVVAGVPLESYEIVDNYICVDKNIVGKQGEYFALKVHGDSMIGLGIFEGDLVVVRKQPDAENNDIVVAIVHCETTVKKIKKVGENVFLEPC